MLFAPQQMLMKYILQIPALLTIGGAEKVARDIGLYSDPSEYEVHYIVFGDKIGEYEQVLLDHGCKIVHLAGPSQSYSRFVRELVRQMKEYPYTAVHAHTMFNAGWCMLAARLAGIPVRITHAHSALRNGTSLKKRLYESLMRHLILSCSTDLIACGEAAGQRLYGERTFRRKGQLIRNGIDTGAYAFSRTSRDRIRNQLHLQNSFVIGHVGHLAAVKNQSFLLRLMPEILKQKPNAKLLMLGEGEDRPMLERLIQELGLAEYVIMTGNVRNVPDYLSAMDVFAFPSLFEGMPLSILEVQANGLPCVLSTSVPRDVFLSDLLNPLPLDEPERWVEAICSSQRSEPERFHALLKQSGIDTEAVMKKFYSIYDHVCET